jgi:hypothetical protein
MQFVLPLPICHIPEHYPPHFHLDLYIRASFDNIGSGLILVLLKVLIEQLTKLGNFFPETVVASGPCISGVQ